MTLHYKQIGDGYPLIILHGLFGLMDNWVTLGKKYGETYNTFLVDQRNHGRSPHHPIFTYDAMAGDLLDFMDEHMIESANIIGHSMGGKTAMTFAVKFPQRVHKLIVADIAPKAYPILHHQVLTALNSVDLSKVKTRSDADKMLSVYIKENDTKQFLMKNLFLEESEKYNWRFNLKVIANQIRNMGEGLDSMYRFNNPTLFVKGEKSDYILDEDTEAIREIFTKAEFATIPGAGHWVHAEKPDAFFELSTAFLKD